MKITKSWAITLITLIAALGAPVVDAPLERYGIHISEQEISHFLHAFIATGAFGGGIGLLKRSGKLGGSSANGNFSFDGGNVTVSTVPRKNDAYVYDTLDETYGDSFDPEDFRPDGEALPPGKGRA